ncbi:hypothetical protein CRENBAI_002019, partial [Crenichthys baileyi]
TVKSGPRFRQHLASVHLSGNEKVSGHCICPLKRDLLCPQSPHGSMTDSRSAEQRADEVVNGPIDCQLTGKVYYTDRPEPQRADLHITNVLITTYESLSGTNLSGPLLTPAMVSLDKAYN